MPAGECTISLHRRRVVVPVLLWASIASCAVPVARTGSQRLVLSSGFLCFSNHVGVIRALDEAKELQHIGAIVGTSSGAIVGSMLAAGMTVEAISALVSARRPLALCRPTLDPWRGIFSASRLGQVLEQVLPERFEDLPLPFAVGVARLEPSGGAPTPVLLANGPLVPAVLASCAVPGIFQPIKIGGSSYVDGGIVDRTFLEPSAKFWREAGGPEPGETLIHLVSDKPGVAFGPRDGIPDGGRGLTIVRTTRTKQSLVRSFGPSYAVEVARAAADCAAVLAQRSVEPVAGG